jgi:hypothetical protein
MRSGTRYANRVGRYAVATINLERKTSMKKIIVSIACCALIAPLAFAKDQKGKNSKQTRAWHFAFVTERPITITAANNGARVEGGAAASYQPAKTLVVRQDGSGHYVLDGAGHVFNSKGELVRTAINPGTRMHVYFAKDDAGMQTIDRVVVD